MYLIYLDESGNTGADLDDLQQPVFLLGALIVEDRIWPALAKRLEDVYREIFFDLHFLSVEVHAGDLIGGRGPFKGLPVSDRVALRNEWLKVAAEFKLKFVYRAIKKARLKSWALQQFPEGFSINAHTIAFPLVAKVVTIIWRNSRETTWVFLSQMKTRKSWRMSRIYCEAFRDVMTS